MTSLESSNLLLQTDLKSSLSGIQGFDATPFILEKCKLVDFRILCSLQ